MKTVRTYGYVAGSLLALLGLTVGAAYLPLGPANTAVAMLISLAKALLIIVFFMHARHATGITRVFVAAGFFWLALLLLLTLADVLSR